MKATINQGKIAHNWRQSPINPEYWRSDCGMIYSGNRLIRQIIWGRMCKQCGKHKERFDEERGKA